MEFGYRVQPNKKLYFDISTFYNFYSNLLSFERGAPGLEVTPAPPHVLVPITIDNRVHGETYGIEIVGKWEVMDHWRLEGGFNWLEMDLDRDAGSTDAGTIFTTGNSPQFQWKLRSFVDLPNDLELDTSFFYVDRLANIRAPQYTRMDMRLGWRPTSSVEVSVGVLNILDGDHYEFGPVNEFNRVSPTRIPRSGYGKVTFQF